MGSSSAAELSIVVSVKIFSSSEQYRKNYILKLPRNNHYNLKAKGHLISILYAYFRFYDKDKDISQRLLKFWLLDFLASKILFS